MAAGSSQPISPLVLGGYFAAGDDRFLPALRDFHEPQKLASIADRYKKDHRPWARRQVLNYLDHPMTSAGHETVAKRLFEWAEEQKDDEQIAAFAVAFDKLVRRVRAMRTPRGLPDAKHGKSSGSRRRVTSSRTPRRRAAASTR
jgi:hypothetical protein